MSESGAQCVRRADLVLIVPQGVVCTPSSRSSIEWQPCGATTTSRCRSELGRNRGRKRELTARP